MPVRNFGLVALGSLSSSNIGIWRFCVFTQLFCELAHNDLNFIAPTTFALRMLLSQQQRNNAS